MDNVSPKKTKFHFTRTRKNAILINTLLLILIVSVALLSPIFAVKNVIISGTARLTDQKVLSASQIEKGKNTFLFRTSRAEDLVKALPFVEDAKIKRRFPTTVLISISECKPTAQVSVGGTLYLVIDKRGKILDSSPERLKYAIPVIEGVSVNEFSLGDRLIMEDEPRYNTMMSIITELTENEMWDKTKRVYYEDSYQIEYTDNLICDLEKGKDIAYKIKFLKEAIANIPDGKTGTIEFIDDYKAVFKPDEE